MHDHTLDARNATGVSSSSQSHRIVENSSEIHPTNRQISNATGTSMGTLASSNTQHVIHGNQDELEPTKRQTYLEASQQRNVGDSKRQIYQYDPDQELRSVQRGTEASFGIGGAISENQPGPYVDSAMTTQTTARSSIVHRTNMIGAAYVGPLGQDQSDRKNILLNESRDKIISESSKFGPTPQGVKHTPNSSQIGEMHLSMTVPNNRKLIPGRSDGMQSLH
jgi:hypothetical protein